MADIFISYSRRDKAFAQWLAQALQATKRQVWIDLNDIPPSAQWMQEIEAAIDGADAFVFILSPDSAASEVSNKEVARALAANKRIIPIVCRDVQATQVTPALAAINWIFARQSDDIQVAFQLLLRALDTDLAYWHQASELYVRAREWEKKGKNTGFTLRGAALAEAEQWLALGATRRPAPTPLHAEFIAASRRSQARRQRTTISLLSTALVVTLVLALLTSLLDLRLNNANATLQRQNQQLNAQVLAGLANTALLNRQNDQALLLATAATQRADNAVTRGALINAVDTAPYLDQILDDGRAYENLNTFLQENVAYSADGKTLMAVNSSVLTVWDMPAGHQRLQITDPAHDFYAALSPDGKTIATHGNDGLILWDAQTGTKQQQLDSSYLANDDPRGLAFSQDGKLLATTKLDLTSNKASLMIWNVASQTLVASLPMDYKDDHASVAFSPDGTKVAASECDGTVFDCSQSHILLFDVASKTRKQVRTFSKTDGFVNDVLFSPNGKYLAAGGQDTNCGSVITCNRGKLTFYDATTLKDLPGVDEMADGVVSTLAFSPNGQHLVAATFSGTVDIWNLVTGVRENSQPLSDLSTNKNLVDVAFDPDGQHFVTSSLAGRVLKWRLSPYSAQGIFVGADLDPESPALYAPDHQRIITANRDGRILFWDSITHTVVDTLTGPALGRAMSLAVSADGHTLAVGNSQGQVQLWDLVAKKPKGNLLSQPTLTTVDNVPFVTLALSLDGHYLAGASSEGRTVLWDATAGSVLHDFGADTAASNAYGIAISPDGQTLAVGLDKTFNILLWDIPANKARTQLVGHKAFLNGLVYNSDGTRLATIDDNGNTFIWDTAKAAAIIHFQFHQPTNDPNYPLIRFIYTLAFSPNGKQLLIAKDTTLFLVDTQSNTVAATVTTGGPIGSTTFSADGTRLLISIYEGPVIVHPLDLPTLQQEACTIVGHGLTAKEWNDLVGTTIAYSGPVCPTTRN